MPAVLPETHKTALATSRNLGSAFLVHRLETPMALFARTTFRRICSRYEFSSFGLFASARLYNEVRRTHSSTGTRARSTALKLSPLPVQAGETAGRWEFNYAIQIKWRLRVQRISGRDVCPLGPYSRCSRGFVFLAAQAPIDRRRRASI